MVHLDLYRSTRQTYQDILLLSEHYIGLFFNGIDYG